MVRIDGLGRVRSGVRLLICGVAVLMLAGCLGREAEEKKGDAFMDPWRARAEVSEGYSPTAGTRVVQYPEFSDEPPKTFIGEEASASVPQTEFPVTPVTIRIEDVDIAVLLRSLCRSVDRNVVMSPGVGGKASLHIVNAPWREVFLSLLNAHDLTFVEEGSMLRILTREERAKQLASERRVQVSEPLVTAVIHVDYADPEGLAANLQQFLKGRDEGGKEASQAVEADGSAVMVDKNTRSLMIQATRGDLERILKLIKHLDRPTPQIHLEAHIVEATRDTARELGIQWGGVYRGGGNHWVTGGNQALRSFDLTQPSSVAPSTGNVVNFPADTSDGGFTLGYLTEYLGSGILSVQLSALEKEGKLDILSRPSITTLNNQKAVIESGKEVPYQTVEDGEVKVEFKKAVVRLEVQPHVIDGRTLRLEIRTSKDELDWSNTVNGNPTIVKKEAQTQVVLFDGQTTVIGGLNKEKGNEGVSGVPFLKDIPFLGYLFKGSSRVNETEELLIFITPKILKNEAGARPEAGLPQP